MARLKRFFWIAVVGVVVLAGVLVLGTLLSLDGDRRHAAATRALPLFTPTSPDGLVRIRAVNMTFRARVAGLGNRGPAVILLHGFPETSAMWKPLSEALAASGHRVVAFDQRGYSPGARPEGVASYAVPELVADVLDVADAVGFRRFHLVGHDWGCVVGWGVAIQSPERVLTWSGLSIPHPGALFAELVQEQPLYLRIFTAPGVAEVLLGFNRFAGLRRFGYQGLPPETEAEYLAVFREPGALGAALNWYRAIALGLEAGPDSLGPVRAPTLFVYGSEEPWVTPVALERQRELVLGPYRELELETGHWLMHARPAEVTEAVTDHLRRYAAGGGDRRKR